MTREWLPLWVFKHLFSPNLYAKYERKMGIVHYVCEDCGKEVGFIIRDDIPGFGEPEVKVKGMCCNEWK